jgi:hypothetical protein
MSWNFAAVWGTENLRKRKDEKERESSAFTT